MSEGTTGDLFIQGTCDECPWQPEHGELELAAHIAELALGFGSVRDLPGALSGFLAGRFEEHTRHTGHSTGVRIMFKPDGAPQ